LRGVFMCVGQEALIQLNGLNSTCLIQAKIYKLPSTIA
jgi:hypothetical protein